MSMSFNQICNFTPGERYCESSQYGTFWFTVKDKPIVYEEESKSKVKFTGVVDDGEEVVFLMTEGLEHYGPSIYDSPAYMSIEELREKT